MSSHAEHSTTVKGPGLARGPAMIVGTILSVAGLALFLHAGDTPTGGFPDADVSADKILGFESNGWTAWITTAAGVLLLIGAAQHLLAKTMSLIVGLGLAACAVIALIDGDVLGLAAANWAVELAWAIAAVILLLNLFAPRITHEERDHEHHDGHRRHLFGRGGHDGRHEHNGHGEHQGRGDGTLAGTAPGDSGRVTSPERAGASRTVDDPASSPAGRTEHRARG